MAWLVCRKKEKERRSNKEHEYLLALIFRILA